MLRTGQASMDRRTHEFGFTLVELLVVILIIGVLAAIAIPAFMNQRERANVAALENDMRNAAIVMETWLSDPKNKSVDLAPPAGGMGWSLVIRHSPDDTFPGDVRPGGASYPDGAKAVANPPAGFPKVSVSEGVALGIVTSVAAIGAENAQANTYCIIGGVKNSPNDPLRAAPGKNMLVTALFYDSIVGGVYEAKDLPPNGACHRYQTSVQSQL